MMSQLKKKKLQLKNVEISFLMSRTKTTHVIAMNLPHAKRKELKPDQKVVKPQWIKDCLKAKQLLSHEPYLVVALDNGTQNRISGFLAKRNSTDSGCFPFW